MKPLKRSDIVAIVSQVVGVAGMLGIVLTGTITTYQQSLHPGAPVVIPEWVGFVSAVASAIGFIGNQVIRVLNNPAGAPATAITADAAVVPAGTTVVHADTPKEVSNIAAATPQGETKP